jgi:ethanolaminephosphotransferase
LDNNDIIRHQAPNTTQQQEMAKPKADLATTATPAKRGGARSTSKSPARAASKSPAAPRSSRKKAVVVASRSPSPAAPRSKTTSKSMVAAATTSTSSTSNWILSEEACARLAGWKYHSGTMTPLDKQMNRFWEFAVTLLPMWMAPNLVTFTGLLIVGATTSLLVWYDPTFSTPAPGWVYFVAMVGHWLYQTFDAIDGKQARRTGSSSPLGQLFDHGIDAYITNLIGLLNGCCMQYGAGYHTILNTLFNFNCFFLAQWEEYHTGVLNINNGYFGLTEGQLAQMAMMLSVAILGPQSWADNNFPFTNIPWRYFALIPMGSITAILALQSIYRVFFSVRQSKLLAPEDRGAKEFSTFSQLLQLLPQYVLYAAALSWTQTPFFQSHILLVFMTTGVACSFYTTMVIVAQMSKSPIDVARGAFTVALPIAACAILCRDDLRASVEATEWLQSKVGGWGDAKEVATYATAAIVTGHYLYYVVGVVLDLSNKLNIYVFSIRKKEKKN